VAIQYLGYTAHMAYRILIVDDEYVIREGLKQVVSWESLGFSIAGAVSSGEEALQFLESRPVDVLLTDIRMPRISGIELARLVKVQFPETQVVILSGYDNFSYAQNAIRYGVYHYLLKPCAEEEIIEVFNRLRRELEKNREHRLSEQKVQKFLMQEELEHLASGAINDDHVTHIPRWLRSLGISRPIVACVQIVPDDDYMQSVLEGAEESNSIKGLPIDQQFTMMLERERVISAAIGQDRYLCLVASDEDTTCVETWFKRLRTALISSSPLDLIGTCTFADHYAPGVEAMVLREQFDRILWHAEIGSLVSINRYSQSPILVPDPTELVRQICMDTDQPPAQLYDALSTIMVSAIDQWMLQFVGALKQQLDHCSAGNEKIEAFLKRMDPIISCCHTQKRFRWYVESLGTLAQQSIRSRKSNCYSKNIRDTLTIIDQRYRENINLEEIARELGLTATYLSKLFKREVGVNFKEFLLDRQISEAKRLLLETHDKIYEVALGVGFSDQHYFSDVFKRCTGLTPLEYRKVNPDA